MEPPEPPDQDAPNDEPKSAENLVSEWLHLNANDVVRERETTRKQLQDALRERDGKKVGQALGSLSERLFFRVQADLARQMVNSKDYVAALFVTRSMIKSNVSSLYREVFGIPLAEVWLSCFDARMDGLCKECGDKCCQEKTPAVVFEWLKQNANDVARERNTAREQLQEATREGAEKNMDLALGSFAERLFFRVQADLARQIVDSEDYGAALRATCDVLRSDVESLWREVVGQPVGQEWLNLFDKNMDNLCKKYGEQCIPLFESSIGIVAAEDQAIQITVGGTAEESGIRVIPRSKIDLPAFVRKRIVELGYRGVRGLAKKAGLSPVVVHRLFKGYTVSSQTVSLLAAALQTPRPEFAVLVEQHQAICRRKSEQKVNTPRADNSTR